MRESMVFYRSFYQAVEDLPPEEFKASVMAILGYGLDGKCEEVYGVSKSILALVKPQIDKNNKRYENSLKGGRKSTDNQTETKPEPNANQVETKPKPNRNQTETKPKPNDNVNVNDNDIKENTLKGVKEKRFAPPTPENVREYCREMGYTHVDADRFVDFYSAKGWMVGKNHMKDWKAATRNWERSQRQESTAKGTEKKSQTRFSNFEQRNYNYDELIYADIKGGAG
nr:MAG TPA: DNA-binding domain protein [Caudoviricetes sp.]